MLLSQKNFEFEDVIFRKIKIEKSMNFIVCMSEVIADENIQNWLLILHIAQNELVPVKDIEKLIVNYLISMEKRLDFKSVQVLIV